MLGVYGTYFGPMLIHVGLLDAMLGPYSIHVELILSQERRVPFNNVEEESGCGRVSIPPRSGFSWASQVASQRYFVSETKDTYRKATRSTRSRDVYGFAAARELQF